MNIRAHHLLCMKYFKGKGYSEDFVSNFYEVIKKLKDNPVIKVVDYPGVICGSCPHNVDDRCVKKPDSEKKVKEKDDRIMKILGVGLNQQIKAADASNLVNLKLDKLKELCKDCEWKKYCD